MVGFRTRKDGRVYPTNKSNKVSVKPTIISRLELKKGDRVIFVTQTGRRFPVVVEDRVKGFDNTFSGRIVGKEDKGFGVLVSPRTFGGFSRNR